MKKICPNTVLNDFLRIDDSCRETKNSVSVLAADSMYIVVLCCHPAISWRGSIGEVPFYKNNLKMDSGQKPAGMTKKSMGSNGREYSCRHASSISLPLQVVGGGRPLFSLFTNREIPAKGWQE